MIRKPIKLLILFTVLLLALAIVPLSLAGDDVACDTRVNNTFEKLLQCVTLEGVREHQAAFQAIADDNGGIRAAGTPDCWR